jgi:hypothetical protein
MHARVATFESDEASIDQMIEGVRKDVESGEIMPGLEDAKELMILVNREKGETVAVILFGSEEGLRRGDEALNKMDPEGSTRRTALEFYEVPVHSTR